MESQIKRADRQKVYIDPKTCSTSVVKKNSLSHLAHEPVKGAVLRESHVTGASSAGATANSQHTSGHHSSNGTHRVVTQSSATKSSAKTVIGTSLPKHDRLPADGSDSVTNDREPQTHGATPFQHIATTVISNQILVPRDRLGLPAIGCESFVQDSYHAVNGASGQFRNVSTASETWTTAAVVAVKHEAVSMTGPIEPQKVTGNVHQLENEVVSLKEQLLIQTKVNADLKKLLVASIGDDLHYKVDALVRTKIQLASEIDDYTKKLVEDYEDLDKMSIQADIWHSKFKASRVLVEQLHAEKERLNGMLINAMQSVRLMLDERKELHHLTVLTHRNLEALKSNSASQSVDSSLVARSQTLSDLVKLNKRLADELCLSSLKTVPAYDSRVSSRLCLSPAEALGHKILSECNHKAICATESHCLHSEPGGSRSPALESRFQPYTRYEGVTFNCCSHCKGEVKVL